MNRLTATAVAIVSGAAIALASTPWSLDSCITYATDNNIAVRQSRVQQLNSEIGVTSAKDAFLPQIHGSASQSWGFGRALTASDSFSLLILLDYGEKIRIICYTLHC